MSMKRIFSLIVAGLAALMLLGSCAESLDEGKELIMRILRTRIVTEDIPAFVSNISVEDSEIVCTEESLFTLYLSVIVGLNS